MRFQTTLAILSLMLLPLTRPAHAQTTRPIAAPIAAPSAETAWQAYRQNNDRRQNGEQRGNRRERRLLAQGGGEYFPLTQPATQPSLTSSNINGDYLVLNMRSIFYKGVFVPPGVPNPGGSGPRPPDEHILVFNGVTETDGALAAYIEDTDSGSVNIVHVGQQIAQGRIMNITLETLDYQSPGGLVHLNIGQNLAGEQVYGTGQPTTFPSGVDMAGPNADVLKKMILRRQQELNGGK